MKFFPLIWSNLKRKKLRTSLTLLSILVAFLLYGYLSAIRTAFGAGVNAAGADRLIITDKVSLMQLLPVSYEARIARLPGVKKVTFSLWFGGIYQKPSNFFPQMVVDPDTYFDVLPEFRVPKKQLETWRATRTGVIVGRTTMNRFGWKIGDRIPILNPTWAKQDHTQNWEFDIVGIYDGEKKTTDTTQFLIHYDYFDETRAYAKGQVGWYVARVNNPDDAVKVSKAIDAEFANSSAETKTDTEKAFVAAFAKQVGDIGTILTAILSAVFFTILLVSGNTMAQAVRERREELGVLKALGFTNLRVLVIVMFESCLMSGLGGLAGLGLAWILIAQGDPTHGTLPIFFFPVRDLYIGFVMVFVLGLISGFMPAIQAMRLNVAEALRRM